MTEEKEWTDDGVMEFLAAYENEPCIWNTKHSHNKARKEIGNAWLRIQQRLTTHKSIEELKRKKEGLMATFRSLINKHRKLKDASNDPDSVPKPNWYCYATMERFLADFYHSRDSRMIRICGVHSVTKQEMQSDDSDTEEEKLSISDPPKKDSTNNSQTISNEKKLKRSATNTSNIQYERIANSPTTEKCAETLGESLPNTFKYDFRTERDECDIYAELFAKKLRKFDEAQREILMNQIDNLIFKARMNHSSTGDEFIGST